MALTHSAPPIVLDSLTMLLDANNYKSSQSYAKNLMQVNPTPTSTSSYQTTSGTIVYDSINRAVLFEADTVAAWGMWWGNSKAFNGTFDITAQYTASFEWKSESQFPSSNYLFQIADAPFSAPSTSTSLISNSTAIGDGWYRFSYTFTPSNSGVTANYRIYNPVNTGTLKTKFWWRKLQLELGSTSTTFIDESVPARWLDLSGSNNNPLNYNNTVIYKDTKGVAYWDFVNTTSSIGSGNMAPGAQAGFTMTTNPIPTSGNFTISAWIKSPPGSGQLGLFSNAGSTDGFRFGPSNADMYFLIGYQTYNEGGISYLSAQPSNKWFNVVGVFNRNNLLVSCYVNGVFQNSASISSGSAATSTSANPGIVRSGCCSLWTGKLSHFSTYSKALSAAEILQNYNALRARYGL